MLAGQLGDGRRKRDGAEGWLEGLDVGKEDGCLDGSELDSSIVGAIEGA